MALKPQEGRTMRFSWVSVRLRAFVGITAFDPQGNSAGILSPGLAGGYFTASATWEACSDGVLTEEDRRLSRVGGLSELREQGSAGAAVWTQGFGLWTPELVRMEGSAQSRGWVLWTRLGCSLMEAMVASSSVPQSFPPLFTAPAKRKICLSPFPTLTYSAVAKWCWKSGFKS